jgi:putative hydrolase of the HAD superfamily
VSGAGGRIEAVTLDAAGTLFTVAEPVGATYARIGARHGIERPVAEVEARFRAAFRAAPPLACRADDPAELEACERAWWRRVVRETLDAGDAPGFAACFDELFAYFADPHAWRLYPDVRPALAIMRAAGIRLAVVSNFDRRLGPIIAGLGLGELFDLIVPSSVAGAAKPAPGIFHHALLGLGVPAARALHAGDELTEDVEGARAAGLRAVLVDRTTARRPADVTVIATLTELTPIVDASSGWPG